MLAIDFTNSVKKMSDQNGFDSHIKVRSREDSGMVVEITVTQSDDLFNKKSAIFMAPCDSDYSTVLRMFNNWVSHLKKYGVPAA
jgi:hypothetical protein